jgi:hypothetical protein
MRLRAALPGPPCVVRRLAPERGSLGQGAQAQPGGSAFSGVVQRVHANVTVRRVDASDPHATAINAFIESVKAAIDKAYQYILKTPHLGVLANLDGHTEHWVLTWNTYLKTGTSQLAAAAFGYAIESMVSVKGSPFRVVPPGGYDIAFQAVKGMTRPDIVLTHGGAEVAWFDLTASDSPLHIFTQKTGWEHRTNIAEITYPSTCITMLQSIATTLSTGDAADFDEATIYREIQFQRFHEKQLRKRFKEMGLNLKKIFVGKMPSKREVGGDEQCRKWTKKNLHARGPFHGLTLTDEQVTAILYALGLNPMTYGFYNSVSQSVGEHLLKIMLSIPHVSAPPETVPFLPPGFGFGPGQMPQLTMPQMTMSPPPFQPQSLALVPLGPPPQPQFHFTLPSFGPPPSTFGPSSPPFGGFNFSGFAPPFGSQTSSPSKSLGSPRKFGRDNTHSSNWRPRIKKPSRFNLGAQPQAYTIRLLAEDLIENGIMPTSITRAALRFRDPLTGQVRTVAFARNGWRASARIRPVYSVSPRSIGGPTSGSAPLSPGPPLMLPSGPTPFSPDLAALFGNGMGSIAALASAEVEMAVVEYDDDEQGS